MFICTALVAEGSSKEPEAEFKVDPLAEPKGKTGAASEAEPGASPAGEEASFAELQKFTIEEQLEAQKVLCALLGGDVVKPEPAPGDQVFKYEVILEDFRTYNLTCYNPPITQEECTSKGGKWGEWCLEEGKCTPDWGCHLTVPKEPLTHTGEKFLQKRFAFLASSERQAQPVCV